MPNEIQKIDLEEDPELGGWTITFDGQTTLSLGPSAPVNDVTYVLEQLSNIGTGNVDVEATTYDPHGIYYTIEFVNAKGDTAFSLMTVNTSEAYRATSTSLVNMQTGVAPSVTPTVISEVSWFPGDESSPAVLTLSFSPLPTTGSYMFEGSDIDWNFTGTQDGWNFSPAANTGATSITFSSTGTQTKPSYFTQASFGVANPGAPQIYNSQFGSGTIAGNVDIQLCDQSGNNYNWTIAVTSTGAEVDSAKPFGTPYTVAGPSLGPWEFTATSNFAVSGSSYLNPNNIDPPRKVILPAEVTQIQEGGPDVPPPPVADFSGSPTSGTAPLTVVWTNDSTGDISLTSFDAGDGGGAVVGVPPATVYEEAGTYSPGLTVTGDGGFDTLVRTNYITVTAAPEPTNDRSFSLSFSTTGEEVLVAASLKEVIVVLGISYATDSSNPSVITLSDSEGNTIVPPIAMAANKSIVLPYNPEGWGQTTSGASLVIETDAGTVTGVVSYRVLPGR